MTVLQVVRDVCAVVGVTLPQSLFANINSTRTMQEMLANANEMAQRIAYDTREWQVLRKTVTLAGDGAATAFNLPADYKRMLLTTGLWRSDNTQQPMRFIVDPDEWLRRRNAVETDAWGEWTILGGQLHIFPAMGAGTTAMFVYHDKNCVALASGGYGDRWMGDDDTFRLDERLLKLGMIFNWKQLKGSPYAEDLGTYSDALSNVMGRDQPAPIIIGRLPISNYARVSGSWPAGWGA
jgi:hypothetical protein